MNLAYEFSKIKDAFTKVRTDLGFLGDKIGENYDDFMKHHSDLAIKVEELSEEMNEKLLLLKEKTFGTSKIDDKEIFDIKLSIKDLKEELVNISKNHENIIETINTIKKNKPKDKNSKEITEIKNIKEKLHTSELEIFLLKERMLEKDIEIKQITDINKHMFSIVDDLSKAELDLLNLSK